MKNNKKCNICHKTESDNNDLLTCKYCFAMAHFECRKSVDKNRKMPGHITNFCSPKCSSLYDRITTTEVKNDPTINQFIDDLKNVMHENTRTIRSQVQSVTSAIEASQQFLSSKFETILADFRSLKDENNRLKREIEDLKVLQTSLSAVVYKQESEIDRQKQSSVANNAVMFGVPFEKNENLSQISAKIFDSIDAKSCCDSIVSVSRMFSSDKHPNAPIRIVFKDRKTKDVVIKKQKESGRIASSKVGSYKTGKKSFINIRDELTPLTVELLNALRQFQHKLNLKYVWPGRDGIVLVKRDANSKPLEIRNRMDLDRLLKGQH